MLKRFGKVVLNYFLCNYPNTYSFKLSIDDYTFTELSVMAGLDEDKLISAIQSRDTFYYDEMEALSIAAYQVKIVGDVDSVMSSGSDSYYQKIRDNYPDYKYSDNNSICNGYFSNQISLWRKVHFIFEKNGRNLEIPEDHYGAGRYVQYPIKSHELKNTELLRWANIFLNRGLMPYDINISYQYFCSLFFPYTRDESRKRTVYNFYKIWDGRSFEDILNRRPRIGIQRDPTIVDIKIVLDYLGSRIEFFNQETGEKITEYAEIQSLLYSSLNRVFFIQNEDDEFYSPKKNKINFGLDFILLSKTDLHIDDSFLLNQIQQNFGKEKLYIYIIKFSKEICKILQIETGEKPPLELVGGLKKSKNCYYCFGLPVIQFSQPQKIMYVNSDVVQIDSDRIVLNELPCLKSIIDKGGDVTIRLSDYLPISFRVEDMDARDDIIVDIGWEYNEIRYIPLSVRQEGEAKPGTVIGFNSTIEFNGITIKTEKIDNRRNFIIRNEYLENRFSKIKGL